MFFWLCKGNQYEFLTHPKIKGLEKGIRTDFLYKARRMQTLNINISGYVDNIIIEFITNSVYIKLGHRTTLIVKAYRRLGLKARVL